MELTTAVACTRGVIAHGGRDLTDDRSRQPADGEHRALPDAMSCLARVLVDGPSPASSGGEQELRTAFAALWTAAHRVLDALNEEFRTAGDGLLLGLWLAFTYRHLTIYPKRQMVEHGGGRHVLTRTEWLLLDALLTHAGAVLPRRQLAELAWGASQVDRSQEVEVYISRLRRKVEVNPRQPELIKTVRGVGYVLAPDADEEGAGGP